VEAAEAVAKVEDWLRAVHGPDLGAAQGAAVRADPAKVRRIPEGWLVPYNSVAYLDEGRAEKQIFPPPSLIVREPEGDLRQAHPHPGGLSIPVGYPGQESWREIVDPDYAAAGLGDLGVPSAAVAGWAKYDADGTKTGEERTNPEYRAGPIRRGYPAPENRVETLLLFHVAGWLSRERFLVGLTGTEVYVPRDPDTGKTHPSYWNAATSELQVFSSTKHLPPQEHGWWKIDIATLMTGAGFSTPPNLVVNGGPATEYHQVSSAELTASLRRFPRFAPKVDVNGRCPEAEEAMVTLAAETAGRLGLREPVPPPLGAATKARKRGYELTADECRKTVLGESWQRSSLPKPDDWAANGLAPAYDNEGRVVPRVDTFGKYFAEDLPGFRYAWQRVTGAYVGFAIGEALGSKFERPGQIGPLTQQLLFHTESVIRSPHREDPAAEDQFAKVARDGLLRWLDTQGVPFERADGWLVKVPELHAQRDPDPSELAAIVALSTGSPAAHLTGPAALVVALPAALTEGGPGTALPGGSRQAVRLLAGLTHHDETDLEAATYLAWLFEKLLSKEEISFPVWALGRQLFNTNSTFQQGPVWPELKAMAEEALPQFTQTGLPTFKNPEEIGDGRGTLSVLGRAFAAISGYENDPEKAILRAVGQSGRSAMTGALVGAMIGARTGIPGLPRQWVEQLELRYAIENLASDAFFHFDRHSALFRYPEYWTRRYPRGGGVQRKLDTKDPEVRSRLRGSLLAGAIGDALGAKTEFDSIERIREIAGPDGITDFIPAYGGVGRITDDTQMTLFTLEALIRAHVEKRRTGSATVEQSLQMAYQRWLHTQGVPWDRARGPKNESPEADGWLVTNRELYSRRAPGLTCFGELEAYGRTGTRAAVARPVNNSKGCGGVMRAAPVALWSDDPSEVFDLGAESAALTHGHPSGFLSSGTFAVLVQQLLLGKPLRDALDVATAELVRRPQHEEQLAALEQALALAGQGPPTPEKLESLGQGNVGETALSMSVYVALTTSDPNTALLASVNHSGDSDSTGSVCGNLVGAMYGEQALRQSWLDRLELREVIEQLAEDALVEFGSDTPSDDRWYQRYPAH